MKKQQLLYILLLITLPLLLTSSLTPDKWIEDINYLQQELPKCHKNLYHAITQKQFEQSIKALKRNAKHLSDDEMVIELTQLMASIGDAHTNLGITKDFELKKVSIGFYLFDDGLFITQTDSSHKDNLAQKVVAINNIAIDTLFKSFTKLVSHENDQWLKIQVPRLFACPMVFYHMGYSTVKDTLRYQLANGKVLTLGVPPAPVKMKSATIEKKPYWLRNTRKKYWCQKNDDRLYIQYNKCTNDSSYLFTQFVADAMAAFDQSPTSKVIIDLRLNSGGDSETIQPLITELKKRKAVHEFSAYTLIGPQTYSSGMFAVKYLKQSCNTLLLGEPSGGSPYSYGEMHNFILPNSKLKINYSFKFFNLFGTTDNTINPDVFIKLTSSQYFRGIDPVMSYVLNN
jgi:hypothetical protein